VPSTSLAVDRYVVAAAVVLTCILFTAKAADPVNVIKLTALLLSALALVATAAYRVVRHRVVHLPTGSVACIGVLLGVGFLISAVVAPVTGTAVYGAYGRNSGLLAYLGALLLFFAAVRVLDPPHTRVLLGGTIFAGLFTASYGLLQRVGVDAVAWNNPFNPIIAALGNPNFASGYLGITGSVAAGAALWRGWATGWRVLAGSTAALCLLAAALSDSVQGPIAAATGIFVVAAGWSLNLNKRWRSWGLIGLAGVATTGLGTLLLGAVAKAGPAAEIFSDTGSVARVFYWDAALSMFADKPLTGVGLDQYGIFWRTYRNIDSVAVLGGPSFSDAAHSVPLQVLAQGGLVLGLAYGAFLVLVATALVRGLLRLEGSDRMLLAAVGGGWAAYQVQSLVSIDQVPLIVLHFVLAGAVLSVSGIGRSRLVRLPGAVPEQQPASAPRSKRRPTAVPRQREPSGADVLAAVVVAVLLTTMAWQSLDPLRANVAAAAGDGALRSGNGNQALQEYEHASTLLPSQSVYWEKLGAFFTQVERPARAEEAYVEALERDRFDLNALRNLARLAEEAGDLDKARGLLDRLLEVDPLNPESIVAGATFELRHAGASRARDLLEGSVLRLPSDASLWATLGDARAVLGDEPGAREAYERAIQLEPAQPVATAGLEKLAVATA
jgi:putative inorganic carbon (HCO3(-)) transporter